MRHKCSCAQFAKGAYCKHAVFLAMLMDPTVKPPAADEICVFNQHKLTPGPAQILWTERGKHKVACRSPEKNREEI